MTHAELIVRAVRWLRGQGCCPVLSELAGGMETPDAIGWQRGFSILVECKASRDDFRRDREKSFRRYPENGMGWRRYYMAPAGMLRAAEMPDAWGLLDVHRTRVTIAHNGRDQDLGVVALRHETLLLSAALRRCEIGVPYTTATARFDAYAVVSMDPPPDHWCAT